MNGQNDKPTFDAKAAQKALYQQQFNNGDNSGDDTNKKEPEKKLDNNQNNDYISDNTQKVNSNAADDKIRNVIEQTFKGDVDKLAEAYLNSQREYQKTRQTTKQLEELANYFKGISEKSPLFEKVLDAIENDIPLETVIQSNIKQEPNKVNQQPNQNGKSNNVDVFDDISVGELVSKGYINKEVYDSLSNFEREAMMQRARMAYIPKLMAEKATIEYQNELNRIKQQQAKEAKKAELQRRYDNSFDNVISKYNFDFTKNPEILDEVDSLVPTYLDPKDKTLWREDAFERAFLEVAESRNLELQKVSLNSRQPVLNTGVNLQTGNNKQPTNLSVEQQFNKRYAEKYQNVVDARKGWRKN